MRHSVLMLFFLLASTLSSFAADEQWEDLHSPELAYRGLHKLFVKNIRIRKTDTSAERPFVEVGTITTPFHYFHVKDIKNLRLHLEHDPDMEEGIIEISHMTYPLVLNALFNERTSLIEYCGATSFFEYMIRGQEHDMSEKRVKGLYLRLNMKSDYRFHLHSCGDVHVCVDPLHADKCSNKVLYDKETTVTFKKKE